MTAEIKEFRTTGTVLEVTRKDGEGAKGPWTLYRLHLNTSEGEHWYSTFEDEADQLRIGDTIRIAYTLKDNPNGKYPYRNISAIIADPDGDEPKPTGHRPDEALRRAQLPQEDRQQRIEWQSARRDAISLMAMNPNAYVALTTDEVVEEVFNIAKALFASGPSRPKGPAGPETSPSDPVDPLGGEEPPDMPWEEQL